MKINDFLKSDNTDEVKIANFSKDVKDWLNLFLSDYQTKRVTPYIHFILSNFSCYMEV